MIPGHRSCFNFSIPVGIGTADCFHNRFRLEVAVTDLLKIIIEHPDQANDRVAVNLAGVEGALKVYENVLTTKPKAKSAFLDGLVDKRNKGELRAYVEEIANTKCKQKT